MDIKLSNTSLKNKKVLARKWRPKNFSQVVGQDVTVRALMHALQTDSLHHAYLFTGNRGVGKTTLARLVAKAVNCSNGEKNEPCAECKTCQEIDKGKFVDVIEIDAASNRGVEEIQQILEQTQYAPSCGLRKVIVIDEVHMLTNHAFNAMLKTLEEPPSYIIFVLATTDPQKIPATVVSRCLQFVLRNIPSDYILNYLSVILNKEGVSFEKTALKDISLAADGSMRDALSITDQAIACGQGKIDKSTVTEMLGLVQREAMNHLVLSIANNNAKLSLQHGDELVNGGVSASSILEELARVFHKATVFLTLNDCNLEGDDLTLGYLCKKINLETAQLYYQIIVLGRRDLSLSPDESIGLQMTLIRLFTLIPKNISDVTEVFEKSLVNKAEIKKKVTNQDFDTLEVMGKVEKKHSIEKLKPNTWVSIAGRFEAKGLLRQFFQQATLQEIQKEEIIILKFLVPLPILNESSLLKKVRDYLLEKFDVDNLTLEVDVGNTNKKNLAEIEREISIENIKSTEKKINEFPLTKKIIKQFNAKIIRDSIQTNDINIK